MSGPEEKKCSQRSGVLALAADAVGRTETISAAERRQRQRHLETCGPCRRAFRRETLARFPRIRNYTILEELGAGGFGVVYKAVHHEKQRTEAIKVLAGHSRARIAYFENEVHLVGQLSHPNIATLYEAHLSAPPLFYAMEYVEGEQLHGYCRRLRLPLEERLRLMRTVALTIAHAHRQGVVHRDLKPQNILIDAEGRPRVVDFGIARRIDESGSPPASAPRGREGAVGTLGYIPPEQLAGRAVDGRADIFSLGAILREAVTGEPMRYADRARPLAGWLRQRQVTRADDLAAIIARCMAAAPEERYETCEALANDLDNYLVGRSLRTARPGVARRTARLLAYQVRYHPQALRAALIVGGAAFLALLLHRGEARHVVPGAAQPQPVLVGFSDSTLAALRSGALAADAPEVSPDDRKSLRVLHGRLFSRLAEGRPSVVIMDYYFPDEQPRFDPGFAAGAAALREANIPLVVAAERLDLNSDPVIAPSIRAVVHDVGSIRMVRPSGPSEELLVPLCVLRGFNPPHPSLALAGMAAALFPDCVAEYRPRVDRLEVQYRLRQFTAGQPRWRAEVSQVSLARSNPVGHDDVLQSGDRVLLARLPARLWQMPVLAYEDALAADEAQLREWLAGRAVVVGHMVPGTDEVALHDGRRVFGCQVHAAALESLLSGRHMARLRPGEIMSRSLLWCALAGMLCGVLRGRVHRRLGPLALVAAVAAMLGPVLALGAAVFVTDWALLEALIAAAAFLLVGGPAYLVAALRRRHLQLTPEVDWSAGSTTVSSTRLRATSGRTGRDTTRTLPADPGVA
ncbi:MAG TPA: protein kinase [Phycisphaerae bacterium]|nr:protein kinase [Phycisphaerae bacterium]